MACDDVTPAAIVVVVPWFLSAHHLQHTFRTVTFRQHTFAVITLVESFSVPAALGRVGGSTIDDAMRGPCLLRGCIAPARCDDVTRKPLTDVCKSGLRAPPFC